METSADLYLHKKFKKQLSIDPHFQNAEKERAAFPIVQNNDYLLPKIESGATTQRLPGYHVARRDSDESVPIISTNNKNIFNLTVLDSVDKSSISDRNVLNLGVQDVSWNIKTEVNEPQSSNNCISYVVSKPARLENSNNENHFQFINFDTKFNTAESSNATSTAESSILDNSYSKQTYVTTKLVSVVKAEDISSSLVADVHDDSVNSLLESKIEAEQASAEKCTVGKYICSYCNLACSKPSVLQKHIRAHTNERPYPCVSCGFSFKTRSNLYKHCRSRTHANRVMGNKAQEINNEMDVDDSQPKGEYLEQNSPTEEVSCRTDDIEPVMQDCKNKPYKPRFHTAKGFFDSVCKENQQVMVENIHKTPVDIVQVRPTNSDLLSLHINEVIHKNNAIVNSHEPNFVKRRLADNNYIDYSDTTPRYIVVDDNTNEEPLNLTNKTRKRCMSEVAEPTAHKSLIKELLLKNLYADTNMQCPYCKMIFQTVTELELHKFRSCKGFTKSGARYSRSSSVNVASILTKNKNAFDTIPYLQNASFPLKSPGPFLGKTRLVESDKAKSFSFDDGLPVAFQPRSTGDILKASLRYSISPLTVQYQKGKTPAVKLFGGEVKITQTSGETKSFKIDNKTDSYGDNFVEYGCRLSENRVVKSSLQSGGTVLQNKPNFIPKQDSLKSSPDVIRVYENTLLSPSIDIMSLEKTKFNFDRQGLEGEKLTPSNIVIRPAATSCFENIPSPSYKYTNIMDFSQQAVKLLTPNLKQPNLGIPGVPVPGKLTLSHSFVVQEDPPKVFEPLLNENLSAGNSPKSTEMGRTHREHINVVQKLQKMSTNSLPTKQALELCNPVNLLVNGKVVRYVPGMPGPIVAETPVDMGFRAIPPRSQNPSIKISPAVNITCANPIPSTSLQSSETLERPSKSPKTTSCEMKTTELLPLQPSEKKSKPNEMRLPLVRSEIKSPNQLPICETSRKFTRPNTLALKPSITSLKQHHGLTPTMFNQILISPDTPRVAKKYIQHYLHGNYFSYLGLKSSTKSVYCTLNKTQPFYVPHFKKLSMYSEWRQQDNRSEKFYASLYDSRQRQLGYVMAGEAKADLVVHSSYKFVISETATAKEEQSRHNSVFGGYESTEEYTYVRGRGRGRYVCDQCGIRCKKPSMLKKHFRTHTNDRPFTCSHCNFSFKTKGNLTKHMKSKAHTKNYTASSSSSSSTQQSGTQSEDSDTEDSGMDSSDESTRQQEHEAAYGLLSLSQKSTQNRACGSQMEDSPLSPNSSNSSSPTPTASLENPVNFMNEEQVTQVNNTNIAKNKILDQQTLNFSAPRAFGEFIPRYEEGSKEIQFLGRTSITRPLTYPYLSPATLELKNCKISNTLTKVTVDARQELQNVAQFNVVQRNSSHQPVREGPSSKMFDFKKTTVPITISTGCNIKPIDTNRFIDEQLSSLPKQPAISPLAVSPTVKISNRIIVHNDSRKRKLSVIDNDYASKVHIDDCEVMDLSVASIDKRSSPEFYVQKPNGVLHIKDNEPVNHVPLLSNVEDANCSTKSVRNLDEHNENSGLAFPLPNFFKNYEFVPKDMQNKHIDKNNEILYRNSENTLISPAPQNQEENGRLNINYVVNESPAVVTTFTEVSKSFTSTEYDNSAMETLADVATKQVKLEKNTLAKSVASEYLKLTAKNEFPSNECTRETTNFASTNKEVNELIVKSEENRSCTICAKNFNKPSQLRLHMNIHYLERPFRCDSCSVSFRTKGHLQKHERSASHHNKLSSSSALSSSEPRPFKCTDCNIAFRIHGHLAKHLRSKMHIMKLECLAKIPFGLYAELERANSLLTEINTTDGDQCLESLKALAKKVFINDPGKLNQFDTSTNSLDADS